MYIVGFTAITFSNSCTYFSIHNDLDLGKHEHLEVTLDMILKKKFLAIWGHWYPCFGFLVTSPLGFKAKVGSA